jgi:transcription elongation factor Elf1
MSRSTCFVQECPTCGRSAQIRVAYLGRQVVCQHCGGQFQARDNSGSDEYSPSDSVLLRRADELLRRASVGPS